MSLVPFRLVIVSKQQGIQFGKRSRDKPEERKAPLILSSSSYPC